MTKEEKQELETKAQALRTAADQAHQAAGAAPGDAALQKAADDAEDAALAAQADVDAAVVDPDPAAPAADEDEDDDEDIDFDKELEGLDGAQPPNPDNKLPRTELERAERALFFQAEKIRKLGGDPTKVVAPPAAPPAPPATPPAAPTPTPPSDKNFVTQQDLDKRDLQAEVRKLVKSEAEYKVILWHAEHSVKQTGDPIKDAENAYLIAHKGKIKRSFDEIRRGSFALPAPGSPPGRPKPRQAQTPTMPASEQAVMKRRGFKPQADGTWVGKHYLMRYDKDKKGWVTERKK